MAEATDHDHLFVDEAGDPVLFNKRGRVIIGTERVSKFFMLGVVRLPEPKVAAKLLGELRASLLADPYFAGVPSMQLSKSKTALGFHAKDDVAEVRREVFKLLPSFKATVQVAVRRKTELAAEARALFARGQKLNANAIYDDLVKRLFHNLLSPDRNTLIAFAQRGKSSRLSALMNAIRHVIETENASRPQADQKLVATTIYADQPQQNAGLQIADYYLWAIQRLFERKEDRFFNLLASDFALVMDLDDQRNQPIGEWYGKAHPLTLEKIKPVAG